MRQRFAIAALALAIPTAWAVTSFTGNTAPAGAHYAAGAVEPTCSVSGLTVSCTGTVIGGVGNTDATLALSVSYSATVQCRNNGGKIVNVKTQITTATPLPDELTDVRNGQLTVSSFSSSPPSTQSFLDAAICPNGNWDKVPLGSPVVSSFTYTLTFDGFDLAAITVTG
jgi:hypothetical protein